MNVPLVVNGLVTPFRSVSPSESRKIIKKRRSPSQEIVQPYQEIISKCKNEKIFALDTEPSKTSDPESFKVFVRIRPLNGRENNTKPSKRGPNIVKNEDNMIFVFDPDTNTDFSRKEKSYIFDNIFDEKDHTTDIYNETLTPAFQNMVQGYNSTILAYGMTGAGKTFTMFGDIYNSEGGIRLHPGFINLIVRDIFQVFSLESQKGFEFSMKMSYIEIYNEQIRDLLNSSTENLMVVEDPLKGIFIPNLLEFSIDSEEDLLKLIISGNSRRVMASTGANQFSSRSHAIIQLIVEKRNKVKDFQETVTQSKLCFVDLAGSERAATTENRGIRMMEGANINKSLLALGNCINILSDSNKKGAFVPYRDSKLTRLLKDSLGGNTRTIMIACISPSALAYEETVNTLNYASRARKIKKKVTTNIKEVEIHVSQYKGIIETLRAEIDSLKCQLQQKNKENIGVPSNLGNQNLLGSSKDIEGVIEKISKSLFINLEENWTIRQNLKDLKDLRKQNEQSLAAKKQEQEKFSRASDSHDSLNREIISLQEVMAYNEVIEKEIEASLEENLREKKVIEDKMLEISAHWVGGLNSSEKIERSLEYFIKDKDCTNNKIDMRKEFFDLHREKMEKDAKIQQLEKEIDTMRLKLMERDKLLTQNEQPKKLILSPEVSSKHVKSSSTTFEGSKLQLNREKSPNFTLYKDLTRGIRGKKIENQTYLQSMIKEKQDKQPIVNYTIEPSKKGGEVVINSEPAIIPPRQDEKSANLNKINKTNLRDPELNAKEPKTLVNAIQRFVRNQSNLVTKSVSINELKQYARNINNINFKNMAEKQTKKENLKYSNKEPQTKNQLYSQDYASPQKVNNGGLKDIKRTSGQKKVVYSYNKEKKSINNQNASLAKVEGWRSPPNKKLEKEISELSSIILQQEENSLDNSVEEYITKDDKKNYATEGSKVTKDIVHRQAMKKNGTPSFSVNINNLVKESINSIPSIQDLKMGSVTQIKSENMIEESLEKKESKSVPYIAEKGPKLTSNLNRDKVKASKNSKKQNFSVQYFDFKLPVYDLKDELVENFRERTELYPLRERMKSESPIQKVVGHSQKSHNLDKDDTTMFDKFSQLKHMRSVSLQQNIVPIVQKSLCSLEDLRNEKKTKENDLQRRSVTEIRSLEAARDLVRTFKQKVSNLTEIANKNLLDTHHSKEILKLISEYSDNKDLLPVKDYAALMDLKTAAQSYLQFASDNKNSSNASQSGPKSSKNYLKQIIACAQGSGTKKDSCSLYKRSIDFGPSNDLITSGLDSVPENALKALVSISTDQDLIYNKYWDKENESYRGLKTQGHSSENLINIYNHFSCDGLKLIKSKDEDFSIQDRIAEERPTFRRSVESEDRTFRIPNFEAQRLAMKQKKVIESSGKAKDHSSQIM